MLRERGALYVDKTERICHLCDAGIYYFLSRPRRFGKSLTVSTMVELFRRRKELFEGLWIYDHWDWEAPANPVIWLEFAKMDYQSYGFARAVNGRYYGSGRSTHSNSTPRPPRRIT